VCPSSCPELAEGVDPGIWELTALLLHGRETTRRLPGRTVEIRVIPGPKTPDMVHPYLLPAGRKPPAGLKFIVSLVLKTRPEPLRLNGQKWPLRSHPKAFSLEQSNQFRYHPEVFFRSHPEAFSLKQGHQRQRNTGNQLHVR